MRSALRPPPASNALRHRRRQRLHHRPWLHRRSPATCRRLRRGCRQRRPCPRGSRRYLRSNRQRWWPRRHLRRSRRRRHVSRATCRRTTTPPRRCLVRAPHRMKRRAMSRALSMSFAARLPGGIAISQWQRSTRCARGMTMRTRGYRSTCADGRRGSRTRSRRNSSPSPQPSPASGRGSAYRDVALSVCAFAPNPTLSLKAGERRNIAPYNEARILRMGAGNAAPRASAGVSHRWPGDSARAGHWSIATRRGWIVSAKCVNV